MAKKRKPLWGIKMANDVMVQEDDGSTFVTLYRKGATSMRDKGELVVCVGWFESEPLKKVSKKGAKRG